MKPIKIAVIDANNIAYRALHTTGNLSHNGTPTGVIYGVINQLFSIGKTIRPDNVIFCWDSQKSKRRKRYSFYKEKRRDQRKKDAKKATHPKEIEEAYTQFTALRLDILPRLGFINQFLQTGYEADDIIASIVKSYPHYFTIISSDEDMFQLLGKNCQIYTKPKGSLITDKTFIEEYKIRPVEWIQVKKIAGCSGDSVPGVRNVGNKRAIAYLKNTMSKESAFYQAIKDSEEKIDRNDWLVRLPLPGTKIPEIEPLCFDEQQLVHICQEYGFNLRSNVYNDWCILFGDK